MLGTASILALLVFATWKGHTSELTPGIRGPRPKVFTADLDTPVGRKKRRDLEQYNDLVEHVALNVQGQQEFLQQNECRKGALQRYRDLMQVNQGHLAQELWKYCALYQYGGIYLDAESPLLLSVEDLVIHRDTNIAVLSSEEYFPNLIHGSLLSLKDSKSSAAKEMITVLVETPIESLTASALLLPKTLHRLISKERHNWYFYETRCSIDPLRKDKRSYSPSDPTSHRLTYHCPAETGYCCQVFDPESHAVVLMTKHPLLPFQILPSIPELSKPYDENGSYSPEELPFIATIKETVHPRPLQDLLTPNFFETLIKNNCLPSDLQCSTCLRNKEGADCEKCHKVCSCYCKTLCHVSVEAKFVSKKLTVSPPLFARDQSRLVPRIIHQTWFEEVTKEKYPNMSRLIESFKQSGWEYKFYTDDNARQFLSTHFPREILQAYDALRPGAFKADLFRYCALLIHGGVYSDMDVMLESNLDAAVGSDIGFMVPVDEPGKPVGRRMCLWNGLIAAAPGHPFLAKIIETVVNNVRNRFTSVDVDAMFCPNPELSVLHAFDTLFTAGPCIMGAMINKVLGRHGQTQFEAGEIFPWSDANKEAAVQGTAFVTGMDDTPDHRIPGRTIILHQDKWDVSTVLWVSFFVRRARYHSN
jgi:mannosyltransferase OCH1-like enzyme